MKKFRNGDGDVLILDSKASASGSNLQDIANHVILVHPFDAKIDNAVQYEIQALVHYKNL